MKKGIQKTKHHSDFFYHDGDLWERVNPDEFEYAEMLSGSLSGDEADTMIILSRHEETKETPKKYLISFIHPRTVDRKIISGTFLGFDGCRYVTIKATCSARLYNGHTIVSGKTYTFHISKILNPNIFAIPQYQTSTLKRHSHNVKRATSNAKLHFVH